MQHLEAETKFELTADDFERLKTVGQIAHCDNQLNVYYDRQWKLAEMSCTLRIRFDDRSGPVLTLKIPVAYQGRKRIMREFEVALAHQSPRMSGSLRPTKINVERELPDELRECLREVGIQQVERVGWVRNTRVVIQVRDVGQIELDRLRLPDGTVVYEAEIESPDNLAHKYLTDLVCQMAPGAKPSRMSKFQRFWCAARNASVSEQCAAGR